MPEGDTVFRAARSLARLTGEEIVTGSLNVPRFAQYPLSGQTVRAVWSYGKHLFIDLDAESLHSHLKMEGAWHVYARGEKWRRPKFTARAEIRTSRWEAVGFNLGKVEIVGKPAVTRLLAGLGPDPLRDHFDPLAAVANIVHAGDRPIGHVLLDQRVIAGVGNVFRNEVCFLLRAHPASPASTVDATAAVEICQRLLQVNKTRSIRSTTGSTYRGRNLYVYRREHRECLRCGTMIRSGMLGGATEYDRNIFWCPQCQPLRG